MKTKRIAHLLAGTVLLAAGSFSAQAATATFEDFNTGNGIDALFSVSGTGVIADNVLQVGLDNFVASSAAGVPAVAVDSFSVNIVAPSGFWISSIDYAEQYSYIADQGVAAITLSVIANGVGSNPASAAFAFSNGTDVGITIPQIVYGPGVDAVALTISNSLFAYGIGGDAAVGKQLAVLSVGLTPVPLPPALGLLGAALIGLTTIGKRRSRAAA